MKRTTIKQLAESQARMRVALWVLFTGLAITMAGFVLLLYGNPGLV